MHRMKHIMHKLIELVEVEVDEHLDTADTCELGEVVDIIKDLAEAIYYCTVTEAMEDKSYREESAHKVETPVHKV